MSDGYGWKVTNYGLTQNNRPVQRPVHMPEARLDLEQKEPLKEESVIQEKLDQYHDRTLVFENEDKIIYLFDYCKSSGRTEVLNRHVLKKLKDHDHWAVIKHPFVLNYVNERILSCTLFYAIHIIVYFFFLFLLYSYVHSPPSMVKNLIVTTIIGFFVFFMLIKATLKLQKGWSAVSFWFKISYAFNLLTYALTLFYVWSFYLFNFDNYNQEIKRTVSWFLPIFAILSSWINCLYVLRKSPCGTYILMMSKILRSFLGTTVIWIPTLLCFAFCFQLIMRDSGTQPWDDPEYGNYSSNIFMAMFQSFTKTSAMMIGEVEANDILERKTWIANLLLIAFEVITVILLMNLMISLAVGDVSDLRVSAEEYLLRIKVNFCIEALHLSEQVSLLDCLPFIQVLHRAQTNNVLVLNKNNDDVFSMHIKAIRGRFFTEENLFPPHKEEVFELVMNATGLKVRKDLWNTKSTVMALKDLTFRMTETTPSGIRLVRNKDHGKELLTFIDPEGSWRKFQRWLIGLNWKALLLS
ncbi:unnamed protein product [Bursaphelenchus okinawaensis]|uniref:Ion_trans domain-containing protein n=1 Tax=Bursaphelenchus okinawaensis TaxID=465554 RepID=A0A811JSX8_9BILA|nr:unnamed protein product [Bursaphelenchus okinawaensis]CAG9081061.1 unnamed protein product [Bursaphelenchus okinawaensis]